MLTSFCSALCGYEKREGLYQNKDNGQPRFHSNGRVLTIKWSIDMN